MMTAPVRPTAGGLSAAWLCALMAASSPAMSDDTPGPLVTDRPDQTESSVVVPKGSVQIEAGFALAQRDQAGQTLETSEFPSTLVRYGLDSRVELRFGWAGYIQEESEVGGFDTDRSGNGDLSLGAKIGLRGEQGRAPQLALLMSANLPSGSADFRGERFDPSMRLLGSHTLSDRLGLGWNVGVAAESSSDAGGELDTFGIGIYTAALGISINDRWGSFVELAGGIPLSGPGRPENSFDAGVTYLVRDNLQLDVYAGTGLSESAPDWFTGFGISFRLPR